MPFQAQPPTSPATGFVQGLGQGLQDWVMPEQRAMFQNKLDMQMLNSRMAMENQLQNQQMQRQLQYEPQLQSALQQVQAVPNDEFSSIMDQVGKYGQALMTHQPAPPLDFSGIQSAQGQRAAMQMMGDTLSMGRMMGMGVQLISAQNADGSHTVVPVNKFTGQPIAPPTQVALTQKAASDIGTARDMYLGVKNLTNQWQNQLSGIISAHGGMQGLQQAGILSLNQLSQTDPNAKAFLDALPFNTFQLDKLANGSVGRAGPQMAGLVEPAIFSKNDTFQTMQAKMNNLRQIGMNHAASAYAAYPAAGLPADMPEVAKMIDPSFGQAPQQQQPQPQFTPGNDPVLQNALRLQGARSGKQPNGPTAQ